MAAMQNDALITSSDLSGMTEHWLGCPPGGYLGSSYGSDVKSLLQSPMSSGLADGLIAKCRQDIPLLRAAQTGTMNVYAYDIDFESKGLVFEVAGNEIFVGGQ